MKSKRQFYITIFIVILLTALATWSINNLVVYGITDETTGKYRTIASILQRYSYQEISDMELQNGSIKGMIDSLDDPDCVYFTAEEYANFEQNFTAEYTGIGVKTTEIISGVMVMEVADESPAANAGIIINDIIIAINERNIAESELSFSDLVAQSTIKTLTVKRDSEEIVVDITKATVDFTSKISSIHEKNGKNFLVINLQQFTDKTANLLRQEITKMNEAIEYYNNLENETTQNTEDENGNVVESTEVIESELLPTRIDGVILDLRNNSGGSVDVARQILNATVSQADAEGNPFAYLRLQDRAQSILEEKELEEGKEISLDWYTTYESSNTNFQIPHETVILVNERTASAAEMVAAGMNEIDGIQLIGNTTYGKGTVQEIIPIVSDGSAIKLTTKRWFTPSVINLTTDAPLKPNETSIDSFLFTILSVGSTVEHINGDRDSQTSSTIANVQMVLSYFGYDVQRSDGLFDDRTEEMLKKFQADNDIEATGKIDAATLYEINERIVAHTSDAKNDITLQKALTKLTENQ